MRMYLGNDSERGGGMSLSLEQLQDFHGALKISWDLNKKNQINGANKQILH